MRVPFPKQLEHTPTRDNSIKRITENMETLVKKLEELKLELQKETLTNRQPKTYPWQRMSSKIDSVVLIDEEHDAIKSRQNVQKRKGNTTSGPSNKIYKTDNTQ